LRPSPTFELVADFRNSTQKQSGPIRGTDGNRPSEQVRDNLYSSTYIGGAQHVETAFAHPVFSAHADQRAQNEQHEEDDPHQFGDGEEVHQRLNSEQVGVGGIGAIAAAVEDNYAGHLLNRVSSIASGSVVSPPPPTKFSNLHRSCRRPLWVTSGFLCVT